MRNSAGKKRIKLDSITACPECGSENISYSKKEDQIVCKDCGGIFSELTPDQEKKFERVSEVL